MLRPALRLGTLVLVLAPGVSASETCHAHAQPLTITNWSQTILLPKHDPSAGPLESVTILLCGRLETSLAFESLDIGPVSGTATAAGRLELLRPDASTLAVAEPALRHGFDLPGFDGTVDFAGPSGAVFPAETVERGVAVVLTAPADLALFTAGVPGETIALGLAGTGQGTLLRGGATVAGFTTRLGGDVSICYARRQAVQAGSVGLAVTNWQQPVVVPKHDPAAGPLRSVRVLARATLSGRARVESPAAQSTFVSQRLAILARVRRPNGTEIVAVEPAQEYRNLLQAFDGTIDLDGPSGISHVPVVVEDVARVVLDDPADLALFTAAFPGETIALGSDAVGTSFGTGPGPLIVLFEASAALAIDVRYDYGAPVAVVCAGDGSSGACPCGNASPPAAQAGCLNSLGQGATLRASGAAEIGDDDLVLTAAGLPATASTLFFQGTSAVATAFGDGLRCAGGFVVRLGTTSASGGVATFPPAGTTVSQAGGATPGTTLQYQGWYRNAATFCTSESFNTTNALSIAW